MVNLSEEQIRNLIEKSANGQLTEVERHLLNRWYDAFEDKQLPGNIFSDHREEAREYNDILSTIHSSLNLQNKRQVKRRWLNIAASIFVVGILTALFFYTSAKYFNTGSGKVAYTIVYTEPGKMKSIELADGSKIWLNSGSKLKYPTTFNADKREVDLLEGEAFFDVYHDDKKPFIVHSKGLSTQVLGTSFNINAYSYLPAIQVSVATGKVGVSYNKKLLDFLTPNQQMDFNLKKHIGAKVKVSASQAKAWMNGEVTMNQVGFVGLQTVLYNNYGYKLQANDAAVTALHFTATVRRNDNIADVMGMLSKINNTRYSLNVKSKTITMY